MVTRRTRLAAIFCVLLIRIPLASAQVLPFTQYTPESEINPLPSAEVHKVYQDHLGYIWMAVFSSGLVRYDGATMTRYTTRDGLRDLGTWEVAEDSNGRLWVGSNGGLVASSKPLSAFTAGEAVTFAQAIGTTPLLDVSVSMGRLVADRSGWLWVGTEGLGIVRYRATSDSTVICDTIRTDVVVRGRNEPVRSLVVRRDGTVWAGLLGGNLLVLSRGGREKRLLTHADGAPSQSTNALYETPGGALWGGGQEGLVWKLDERKSGHLIVPVSNSLNANISSITSSADGSVWVVSEGSGVLKVDSSGTGNAQSITRQQGLLSDVVHNVFSDREQNLWFAQSGGVSKLRYNYRAFYNYTAKSIVGEQPALPAPSVNAVLIDETQDGLCDLWVGTSEGGVTCLRQGAASETIAQQDGLRSNWVNGLQLDSQGRLWIGSARGIAGIALQPSAILPPAQSSSTVTLHGRRLRLRNYATESALSVSSIPLFQNAASRTARVESIWFPSYQILTCLIGDEWFSFGSAAGLPVTVFHAVAYDDQGRLWVGTRDRGLYRSRIPVTYSLLRAARQAQQAGASDARQPASTEIRRPLFERVWSRESGAPTNEIETLAWRAGILWVGTPAGLIAVDGRTMHTLAVIGEAQGLPAGNATSMAFSPRTGALWVGTNQGLAEVDPAKFSVRRTITKNNGLVDNEVWFYQSVRVAQNGVVYFGTAKGLAVYNPRFDRPDIVAPLIRITRFDYTGSARGENTVSFEYAAQSFSNERQVTYQTRLIGHDHDWSPPTTDKKIRYTNLPAFFGPRQYTFEVRALTESGVLSATPARYSFLVQPAWWLRWWSLSIALVCVLALGFAIERVQRGRVLRAERHRALEREQQLRVEAAEAFANHLQMENDRKTRELEGARELQLSMLPRVIPKHPTVDIAAFMKTATEVGGDYYDFHVAEDGTLTVAIGDATGHGVSAGTMVTATKMLFSFLASEESLDEILRHSTASLRQLGLRRMYMALGLVRLRDMKLELAGAGMPAALIYRAEDGTIEAIPLKGMPLGSTLAYPYQTASVDLKPGDTVVLMSDGFPELFGTEGEMLGYDRVVDIFADVAHLRPNDIVRYFDEVALSWTAGASTGAAVNYKDDLTFVVIKVKPYTLAGVGVVLADTTSEQEHTFLSAS